MLAAIVIFVNGAKGIAALQLSRDLDCQYKTAFVLAHKLREAMASGSDYVRNLYGGAGNEPLALYSAEPQQRSDRDSHGGVLVDRRA